MTDEKSKALFEVLDDLFDEEPPQDLDNEEVNVDFIAQYTDPDAAVHRLKGKLATLDKQLRRGLLEKADQERQMAAQRPALIERLADWTEEQLLAQIEKLRQKHQVQVAHRDLREMPLEDLRTLVADLMMAADDDEP